MRRACIAALAALLAAGCATTVVRDEPLAVKVARGAEAATAPLAEALLAHERGTRAEALEVAWKDKAFTAEIVTKGDGETLKIVLLAPQMRLATLTVERPRRITWERAPRVPAALAPEYALFDIAFVRLPADALAAALGPAFLVKDDGVRRVLLRGGEEIRVLERRGEGELLFVNPSAGYECRATPMETAP